MGSALSLSVGVIVVPEPWRVAVVGPERYPDANRRVYARLKMLRDDWPKASFHIITATTGAVATAALRAAKKLLMEYTATALPLDRAERVIAYWDFECVPTSLLIEAAIDAEIHIEVWDGDNEPRGADAADAVKGLV